MSKNPKWLDRALVVCPYYFTLATSEKKFKKAIKRFNISDVPPWLNYFADATTHTFQCGDKLAAIVCIHADKDKTIAQIAALLAHEAMHIWRYTLKHYGEKKPSFEFEAYAVQSLTQRLVEEYVRQTAK